jgi:hypothetical protein
MASRDSSPKPKLRPKKSVGEKIKDFADKYNLTGPPTEATKAARDRFLSRNAPSRQGGLPSLVSTGLGGLSKQKQYEENLRRYNEYMEAQGPAKPEVTPEMRKEALSIFESQQGAGQMPYYMAASQGATSPAFQYAAQNYGTLGGSQRLGPRPMEMMSVAERRQINDMAQGMADQQAEEQRLAEEERLRQIREKAALHFGGKGGSKAGSQQAAANDYQAGMDMVMRGGMGKGGSRTAPQMPQGQTNMPPNFGSMLASRFGMFGR